PGFVPDTGFWAGRLTSESRRERAAQTLVGRGGTPEEGASLIAWLLGPDGGWVTGQVLCPNGGVVLGRLRPVSGSSRPRGRANPSAHANSTEPSSLPALGLLASSSAGTLRGAHSPFQPNDRSRPPPSTSQPNTAPLASQQAGLAYRGSARARRCRRTVQEPRVDRSEERRGTRVGH